MNFYENRQSSRSRSQMLRTSVAVAAIVIAGAAVAAPPQYITTPISADGTAVGPAAVNINTGLGVAPVVATNNGTVTIVSGSVSTESSLESRSWGLLARNGGVIDAAVMVQTAGDRGHAVQAGANGTSSEIYDGSTAGVVNLLAGTNVITDGDYAVGLHALDGSVINADGISVTTHGANSPGAHAESNSTVNISGSYLLTNANGAHGLLANNDRAGATGGQVVANGTDVTTYGDAAHGAVSEKSGSVITFSDGMIATQGLNSFGVLARDGGQFVGTDLRVLAMNSGSHGVQAGVNVVGSVNYGEGGGNVQLTGGRVGTGGTSSVSLSAVDGGRISASDVVVHAGGDHSIGVHANSLSQVDFQGGVIDTYGVNGHGIHASNNHDGGTGGVVNASGAEVHTRGAWAHGVYATGAGSEVNLDQVGVKTQGERGYGLLADAGGVISGSADILTSGLKAHGVQAGRNGTSNPAYGENGGDVFLAASSVETRGAQSVGLHAVDGGKIGTSSSSVATSGHSAFGAHAESLSSIEMAGGQVATSGTAAHGVVANNDKVGAAGGLAVLNGVAVAASGAGAHGLLAENGARITTVGGTVATGGENGFSVYANSHSQIDVTGTAVSTSGGDSFGIHASNHLGGATGGTVNATGASVQTQGAWSHGVYATGTGSQVALAQVSVKTEGERGYGLLADAGGVISGGVNILTTGLKAHAVQAGRNGTSNPDYGLNAGEISLVSSSIVTQGNQSSGLHAVDAGTISFDGSNITTSGEAAYGAHAESQSTIRITAGQIATSGALAHGVVANNDRIGAIGGAVQLTGVAISTSGDGAHGILSENGGSVSLQGGSVVATGSNGIGVLVNGGTIGINGASIASGQAAAISLVGGGELRLQNASVSGATTAIATSFTGASQIANIDVGAGSVVRSRDGVLVSVDRSGAGGDSGIVNVTLADGSNSTGDILDLGNKSTGYTDLTVGAEAVWVGQALGVRNVVSDHLGGDLFFAAGSILGGNLITSASNIEFAPGVIIMGDFSGSNGTSTTGGSVFEPIRVGGNASFDASSIQGGNWYISGNLINQGTITPGNSIGVVTVGGNFNQGVGSVYQVEINALGQSDQILVGGVATLGGRVEVSPYPANGGYLVGTPYAIVSAAGGLGGTTYGGGVTWAGSALPIFLAPVLSYDANNAYVTIDRSGVMMTSVAATPNQYSVAGAIDRLPVTNGLFNAVAFQNSAFGARQAFDAISGEAHASMASALVEQSGVVRSTLNNRLRDAFGGDVSAADKARTNAVAGFNATIWGQAFGTWGHSGSRTTAKADRSSAGFLAGVDVPVFDTWRLGLAAGYSRSTMNVDQRLSSSSADSYHTALYGGTQFGALGLRFGAAYTWNDARANRTTVFSGFSDATRSSYRSGIVQVFGETSYKVQLGASGVEPFFNLAYVNLDTDSFNEFGGTSALRGKVGDMSTTFTTLGARASHTFTVSNGYSLTARGALGWRHAFGDVDPRSWMALAGGASSFTVTGAPIARNSMLVEAGLDLNVVQNVSVGVSYTGQIADHAQDHAVKGNVAVKF